MDNSTFDQWLRDKMSRLEGEIPPADWARMNDRLNEEAWIDAQNEEAADFDQTIRQRLSNTPTPPPANWDAMAEKLDQEFGIENLDDVILDGVVYEQLHQYNAPYNANHWPIMEQKLEETYSIRRKLVKYKVAEVSLMLLLIFTLLQYLPYYPIKKKAATTTSQEAQPFSSAILSGTTADQAMASSAVATQSDVPLPASDPMASINQTTQPTTALQNTNGVATPPTLQSGKTITLQAGEATHDQLANIATLDLYAPTIQVDNRYPIFQNSSVVLHPVIFSDFNMLDGLTEWQLPSPEKILPGRLIQPDNSTQNKWQVGMIVASDMNYINPTEAEFRFRLPDYDEMNFGYGGGLSVTIPVTKRWAFETGLIYASAYYLPNEINAALSGSFRNGFFITGFQSAQLHLLKVPIQAQYAFNTDNSRWRWYGIMGASVNVAMIQEYYYRSIPEPTFQGNTRSSNNLAAELADQYSGLIDGGQVNDNLQVTANIGMGLERYFSPRWSVFIQPVYQHDLRLQSLQGFGPYQDRINSLSFYFGSKVTLK